MPSLVLYMQVARRVTMLYHLMHQHPHRQSGLKAQYALYVQIQRKHGTYDAYVPAVPGPLVYIEPMIEHHHRRLVSLTWSWSNAQEHKINKLAPSHKNRLNSMLFTCVCWLGLMLLKPSCCLLSCYNTACSAAVVSLLC